MITPSRKFLASAVSMPASASTMYRLGCDGKCYRRRRCFAQSQAHLRALESIATRFLISPGSRTVAVSDRLHRPRLSYSIIVLSWREYSMAGSCGAAAHPLLMPRKFTDSLHSLKMRQFCAYEDSRSAVRLESSTGGPPNRELPGRSPWWLANVLGSTPTLLKFVLRAISPRLRFKFEYGTKRRCLLRPIRKDGAELHVVRNFDKRLRTLAARR